eukprot:1097526-Pyramimonas_sp.AAC.1
MQRSELGLLPELGPQRYSYYSSYLDRCCRVPVRCAFICCIYRSELGLLPEIAREPIRISRVILRGGVGFLELTRAVGQLQS